MTHTDPNTQSDIDLHEYLAQRNAIAIIWCREDVSFVRPDLTPEQCWTVLQQVERNHDSDHGISWDKLESMAEAIFGEAASSIDIDEKG